MTTPMPAPAWTHPHLGQVLEDLAAARERRQAAKLERRAAKVAAGASPVCDLATGRPLDEDFVDEPPVDVHALVVCPGFSTGRRTGRCGRTVLPGMLRLVTGLPAPLIGSASYLCDACCEALLREGLVDAVELARQAGAPPAYQAWLEAKLERDPYANGHTAASLRRLAAAGRLPPGKRALLDPSG